MSVYHAKQDKRVEIIDHRLQRLLLLGVNGIFFYLPRVEKVMVFL